jgi:hypothetical protein
VLAGSVQAVTSHTGSSYQFVKREATTPLVMVNRALSHRSITNPSFVITCTLPSTACTALHAPIKDGHAPCQSASQLHITKHILKIGISGPSEVRCHKVAYTNLSNPGI